jgi:hypothetical protein
MNKIIKASLFTPGPRGWGLPLLIWGLPGTAKSDIIESIAKGYGLHCEVLSPGERGEGAFGVVPVPTKIENGMVLSYPKPDWVDLFDEADGRGVVFVDETNTAPPAVQPALLGLLQARRIGGSTLPKGVRVIGAANPTESATNGYELPPAVANRMGHIDHSVPTSDEWTEWLLGASATKINVQVMGSAEDEEERVLALWDDAYAQAKGVVAGFVKARPAHLHKMPAATDPQASRAWPSHRTWDMACRAFATSIVHALEEHERNLLISSFVGSASTTEFVAYAKAMDLPNPADLLDGKTTFKHNPSRLDRTFAVLTACTAHVTGKDVAANQPQRVEALWSIMGGVQKDAPDLIIPAGKALCSARLQNAPTARPVLVQMNTILKAAGFRI